MKLQRLLVTAFLIGVAGLAGLVACGDDETTNSGGASSSSGTAAGDETVTVRVSAASGGSVADKAGKAKLDIPAGALAQDTDITLKISAKTGNAVADVADFGPNGLQFLKPATLQLKGDASLANGKSLAVGIEDGTNFKAIEGSTFANGVATANVEHFTKFTLVVVDGKVTLVDPASCQDARAKFVACGGDPKGNWQFADFCLDPAAFQGGDPTGGQCPQYTITGELIDGRDVTIDATNVTVAAGPQTTKVTSDFPLSCFQQDGGGSTSCEQFSKEDQPCTDKGGGQCRCEQTKTEQKAGSSNPWTVSGNTFTSGGDTGEYCVSGDILYYKSLSQTGNAKNLIYVLKRK